MSALKEKYYRLLNFSRKLNFYLREKTSEIFDAVLLFLNVNDSSVTDLILNSKTIVVTGLGINHRVIKNIKYLKSQSNYQIIILTHVGDNASDLLREYYHYKFSFRNRNHLKRLLSHSEKLSLIYTFTSKPSYSRAAVETAKCSTMFDPYDCMVIYYGKNPKQKWMRQEIIAEAYCFKNATGILARNLEIKKSFSLYDLKSKPLILYSDYCDNAYFANPEKKETTSEISLVYAGGIYGRHMQKSSHGIENFSDFIDSMNDQKVDFHIYPSPHTKPEVYYDYEEESKKLKYLHLHKTVLQKDLANEISGYHFGVSPHFKEESSLVSKDKLERGTSLKFFNFLEAGLPILMSDEMNFMAWLVKRYEIGIVFGKNDIPNLAEIIRSYDYIQLQANVIKVREKLSMANNYNRMQSFIEKLENK